MRRVGDTRFLLFAIPGLVLLVVIPMVLARMSRNSYVEAEGRYREHARSSTIGKITVGMTGAVVRVVGSVEKVSFKWLNRPHFQVKDRTGIIRAVMFTSPVEEVKPGDRVEVLGVVMKNVFSRGKPAISAVSVRKATR